MTRSPIRRPLAITLLGLLSAPAFADATSATSPTDFDTIVVTAAGFEQKLTDAPASISVITQEDLAQRPYMTLLDAVRDLEGVDIGETRDKTGQGTISMRGMGSDYTLILVNGRRQNNHGDIYPNNFGGNQFNHIPPLDAIERIEVIRGPMSTLYGADAMGGVINVITKRELDSWSGSVTLGRNFQTDDQFGDDTTADFFITGPLVPGRLNLSARGSWYERDASNPVYDSVVDPNGEVHNRALGFGGGGKTVDNTNKAAGVTLTWMPTDAQTVTFEIDASRQEYDNSPRINDDGVAEYPVGTVDDYGAMLRVGNNGRVEPRAGYRPSQEFTRNNWSFTHEGRWSFGNSAVSLAYVETDNKGRTLPFTVGERQSLQGLWNAVCDNLGGAVGGNGYCANTADGTGFTANAWNNMPEAQKLALMEANLDPARYAQLLAYLPRPDRTLESNQYTLDAKLDLPFQWYGEHMAVIGAQLIQGELIDGVFGMERGTPGAKQEHDMYSLFVEDTWSVADPFSITAGLRYDDHKVFGNHVSPRLYGVWSVSEQWTVKGGVSTGFKTPKTTQLYDGITGFGGQGVSPMFGNPDLQPETSTSSEIAAYWQHPDGHGFNATIFRNEFDDKIGSESCGPTLTIACASTGEYADLGYANSSKTVNIDEVVVQGAELAGRWNINEAFGFRANYTYTDSEQKSGSNAGRPLGNSARHMANATLDWRASDAFNVFLTAETRSKRYRGFDTVLQQEQFWEDYTVLHLGASYEINESITLNGRINNLLDRDFTSYQYTFIEDSGSYTLSAQDDYNNKDKARSIWLSVNVRF